MNPKIKLAAASYIEADQEFQSYCYDWDLLGKHDSETQKGIDFWRQISDDRYENLANLLALEGIANVSKWIFDNAYNCFEEEVTK